MVEEYKRSGKAICNGAGQVTLPNGAFIPRHYQAAMLQDGFDNFYNQNPAYCHDRVSHQLWRPSPAPAPHVALVT